MKTSQTIELTDATFEAEVLASELPVLVDFWAPWCAPCRAIGPVIEELAEEFEGRAQVGKVNVDENSLVAGKYGIDSIPRVLVFRDGEVVETLAGIQIKERYRQAIDDDRR